MAVSQSMKGVSSIPLADGRSMTATYIGHASVLLEMHGCSLITDPMFSDRLATIFTKRRAPMRFDPSTVPALDAVLLSHGHHDHMDLRSLKTLGRRRKIILPRGLAYPLMIRRFRDVVSARPGESFGIGTATVTVVPAHHFGGRPPFYFTAGYQGYVISHEKCVYFAGDTGFDEKMFRDIGRRFAIDLAILPIGAYYPPSFRKHHMNPEDAVEALRLLGAKHFIPIHFETFSMSMEPIDEPRKRLVAAATGAAVMESLFILNSGESLCLNGQGAMRCDRLIPSKAPL